MLYRDFVDAGNLKSIFHAYLSHTPSLFIMHVHILYMGTECVHNQSTFYTSKEEKALLRLIHFKECTNAHSAPFFFKSKIVKLPDKIKIGNCLFISKYQQQITSHL